jgi:hypothetical protein
MATATVFPRASAHVNSMQCRPTPDLALRRLAIAAATLLLALGSGTMPAVADHHGTTQGDPPAQHPFSEAYALAGAVDASAAVADALDGSTVVVTSRLAGVDERGCAVAAGTDACPMFGVAICDLGSTAGAGAFTGAVASSDVAVDGKTSVPSVGGACGSGSPRLVRGGDTVTVGVSDDSGEVPTFGVCVDGNRDDLCRPESFLAEGDTWIMSDAGRGSGDGLSGAAQASSLTFAHSGLPGPLYVFLFAGAGSRPTTGTIGGLVDTATSGLPECADGLDNDGDGDSDRHDLGCVSAGDGDERGEAPRAPAVSAECLAFRTHAASSYLEHLVVGLCDLVLPGIDIRQPTLPECADLQDNDPWPGGSDGADWPLDPDCEGPLDDRERGPACSDRIDNDGDGRTDHPADPGCTSPSDDDEFNPWACSDGKDNDGDGRRDHPNDPGCSSPGDNDETNPWACSDGLDNDRDGRRDYPYDPGCTSRSDNDEWNPAPKN